MGQQLYPSQECYQKEKLVDMGRLWSLWGKITICLTSSNCCNNSSTACNCRSATRTGQGGGTWEASQEEKEAWLLGWQGRREAGASQAEARASAREGRGGAADRANQPAEPDLYADSEAEDHPGAAAPPDVQPHRWHQPDCDEVPTAQKHGGLCTVKGAEQVFGDARDLHHRAAATDDAQVPARKREVQGVLEGLHQG